VIGVTAHQRGQVESHAQARAAGGEQASISLVGLFRRTEPGKLPHRPELASIARGVQAARVRELPWVRQISLVVKGFDAVGRVDHFTRAHPVIISFTLLGSLFSVRVQVAPRTEREPRSEKPEA